MIMDDIMCMQLDAYIDNVTDGIVEGVKRLQEIGESKVLVNSLLDTGTLPSVFTLGKEPFALGKDFAERSTR
jgi:hypothetical protein